jgi:hypothetical protein
MGASQMEFMGWLDVTYHDSRVAQGGCIQVLEFFFEPYPFV